MHGGNVLIAKVRSPPDTGSESALAAGVAVLQPAATASVDARMATRIGMDESRDVVMG